jgi:acyl-CoA dehydrogenase
MDFATSTETQTLKERVRAFIDQQVIPHEAATSDLDQLRQTLQTAAKAAGLFGPQLPVAHGGLGLSWLAVAEVLMEAGRSLLGPQALNAAAPDEGNMHLLAHAASPAQQAKYLLPLASGAIRSAFAMTEPAPGAGSDPSLLQASASAVPQNNQDGWLLQAHKWFITGARGAAFFMVLTDTVTASSIKAADAAATTSGKRRINPTIFLVDADNPGLNIVREIKTLDHLAPGGHCELELRDCWVPASAVLGQIGQGFELAQYRLGPARLTHCMRWFGVAKRALEIAMRYVATRVSFGKPLSEHQAVQLMLAESEIELHAARLMILEAAWKLDQGQDIRTEASMAKVFVSETVYKVVDRAIQMCGSLGISDDVMLATFFREVRPFRIYDGPNEVHRVTIARRMMKAFGEQQTAAGSSTATAEATA